jgi:hypothetical protein
MGSDIWSYLIDGTYVVIFVPNTNYFFHVLVHLIQAHSFDGFSDAIHQCNNSCNTKGKKNKLKVLSEQSSLQI